MRLIYSYENKLISLVATRLNYVSFLQPVLRLIIVIDNRKNTLIINDIKTLHPQGTPCGCNVLISLIMSLLSLIVKNEF